MNNFIQSLFAIRCLCFLFLNLSITLSFPLLSPSALEDEGVYHLDKPIPSVLIPVYSHNGTSHAIVVEKVSQRLYLFKYNDMGSFDRILEFPCSTGKSHGPKTVSGDAKTPEGIYFFTRFFPKRDLSPIYGIMAFVMDYPNLLDQMAGRTGSAIWLHGTNKPLEPYDSNGCIVMNDQDLSQIATYIELNRTPIIVVEHLDYLTYRSNSGTILSGLITGWHQALAGGTYHHYLNYYDADYLPDIQWWSQWIPVRSRIKQAGNLNISAEKISIFKAEDFYVALFDQNVFTGEGQVWHGGSRKLFFQESRTGFTIIGDDYLTLPDNIRGTAQTHPFLALTKQIPIIQPIDQEIDTMLKAWIKAWSTGDIKQYSQFYARDFFADNMNRKAWIERKQFLADKYDFIHITIRQTEIKEVGAKRFVSFIQHYKSSGHNTIGKKILTLKHEDGQWKIYREAWEKM